MKIYHYGYDYRGYLVSETKNLSDFIHTYQYDNNGNITRHRIVKPNSTNVIEYTYDTNSSNIWKDRLINFTSLGVTKTIKYDDPFIGNPTFYGNETTNIGIHYNWNGRQLINYVDDIKDQNINYVYNDKGLRIKKISQNTVTTYDYENNKLIFESTNDNIKQFLYDENNILYGMIYNNTKYYYIKDTLLTIIGLTDENGNIVCEYEYDAFGNVTILKDELNQANPFLFKCYYYDYDTEMYYLKTRYYVPLWCRFLNADGYLEKNANGKHKNPFIYCDNNPVMYHDSDGMILLGLFKTVLAFTIIIAYPIIVLTAFCIVSSGRKNPFYIPSKEEHYNRLNYQTNEEMIKSHGSDWEENVGKQEIWTEMKYNESKCHQFTAESIDTPNTKYICNEHNGAHEFVKDIKGTIIYDPKDIGTYNYYPSGDGIEDVGHFFYDVLPWLMYGNSEDDDTTFLDRFMALLS